MLTRTFAISALTRTLAISALALVAFTALPAQDAAACGPYEITDDMQVKWAVGAHLYAVKSDDVKRLKRLWSDVKPATLRAWTRASHKDMSWTFESVDIVTPGAVATATVRVRNNGTSRLEGFLLINRDGQWHLARRLALPRMVAFAASAIR